MEDTDQNLNTSGPNRGPDFVAIRPPVENPPVENPDQNEKRIAELELKIQRVKDWLNDLNAKLNTSPFGMRYL